MSRIAIVTGANKGIGLETCRALVKSGQFAHVYLTSRNTDLGHAAVKNIQESTPNSVKYHQLDIACEKSISTFRDYIKENHQGFDVLGEKHDFYRSIKSIQFKMLVSPSKTRLLSPSISKLKKRSKLIFGAL